MNTPSSRHWHQPALDGVRAVAVLMVLVFHLDVGWASGGYLGVSVFFTLSGYLITALILRDHVADDSARLGTFYLRRLRRLIPASTVALAGIVLLVAVGVFDASDRLRGQITAAAFQALNWFELARGTTYADLFVAPSPVAHFWSLAIEEQFYWLWPVVLVWCWRRRDRWRRGGVVAPVVALWLLTSISAPLTAWWWSPSAAYYASWARASEILAGAALAAWLVDHRPQRWWRLLPLPSLGLILLAGSLAPAGRGFAYSGGLPLFALLGVALIAGLQVDGPLKRILSIRPLVALGTISYGVYLYHWPVYLVLDADRTGTTGLPLAALRLATTIALAVVSYLVIERPLRHGSWPRRARTAAALSALGAVGVTVGAFALVEAPAAPVAAPSIISAPPTAPAVTDAPATTGASTSVASSDTTAPDSTPPGTTPPDTTPPRVVAIIGDSVPAWLLRDAAPSFARTEVVIVNGAKEACDGMVDPPPARDRRLEILPPAGDCMEWTDSYPPLVEAEPAPDLALLVVGQTTVFDHFVDDAWISPCQTLGWYLDDLAARIDYLRAGGLDVVFALPARPGDKGRFMFTDDMVERMECARRELRTLLERAGVPVVDLDRVLCPDDDCDAVRGQDGVHVDPAQAPQVLDWLLDETLAAVATTP